MADFFVVCNEIDKVFFLCYILFEEMMNMKKIIALLLATVIAMLSAFSAFSFGGFDEIQGSVAVMNIEDGGEEEVPPETENETEEKLLALEWINGKGKEICADVSLEMLGITVMEAEYHAKNGAYSVDMPYKNGLTRREIYTKDCAYAYITQFPFFYLENDKKAANLVYSGNLKFVESCEEDGYYVEKYIIEESGDRYCFYFSGEEMKIITKTTEYEDLVDLTVEYKIKSYEVDNKYMEVPFYAINVTPIYYFLALLGIV